jgi:PKD repeat protein
VEPVAQYTWAQTQPLTIKFTNISDAPGATWSWDFGDGTGSARMNPSHTYNDGGTYLVSLAATNGGGTDTFHNNVVVVAPPDAGFSFDGSNDPMFSFTDESIGEVTAWSWEFDDGFGSTAQNPNHTYAANGTYSVSLLVSGPGGDDLRTREVVVTQAMPAPNAHFSVDNQNDPEFSFYDFSTGEITGWFWDFGDGRDSNAKNPTHTYLANDFYVVTLIVSGPGGDDSMAKEIEVNGVTP